jgi:hypothetical protein
MKRFVSLGAAVIAVAFASTLVHSAPADSKDVDVSATILGVGRLTVSTHKIADDTLVAPNKINFGSVENTVGEWSTLPTEYVKVTVEDNETAWKLKTYSDNFGGVLPDTTTWGWQFGGMIATGRPGAKVALGWLANPTLIAAPGPGTGNPANGRAVDIDGKWIAGGNGFTYLKDKADGDAPEQEGDQSFHMEDDYINIAQGSFSETRIMRPNLEAGNEKLDTQTTPFYVYVEGQFNGAPPAVYSTTIKLDLVNE